MVDEGQTEDHTMSIRILVIEDDERIAGVTVRGLREEGYSVDHMADGESAWSALKSGGWDLVLLDWWLPGEEGLSLLKRFRQNDRSTPVLMLTARDAVSDRVRGLDGGADDYLCKPFAFEELLARVRALVRRRDASDGVVVSYDDVKADLAGQRAERAGQPLNLTGKEFALLVLFLRHPGQVLSRTRIYTQIWDDWPDGVSNTLEVHIKELRRKLELRGHRLIHTIRGRGYWFGDPASAEPMEDL